MPKSPRQTTGARLNIVRRDGIFISGDDGDDGVPPCVTEAQINMDGNAY